LTGKLTNTVKHLGAKRALLGGGNNGATRKTLHKKEAPRLG